MQFTVRRMFRNWLNFWFGKLGFEDWSLLRIGLGLFLAVYWSLLFANNNDAFQPGLSVMPIPTTGLGLFNTSDGAIVFNIMAVVSALVFAAGLEVRFSATLNLVLWAESMQRAFVFINGEHHPICFMLFCTAVGLWCGGLPYERGMRSAGWGLRLIQVWLALAYVWITAHKLIQDPAWRDGSAVAWVSMSHRCFWFNDWDFLRWPLVSSVLTYVNIVAEGLFPLFCIFPRWRTFIVYESIFMHLGIMLTVADLAFYFNLAFIVMLFSYQRYMQLPGLALWWQNWRMRRSL